MQAKDFIVYYSVDRESKKIDIIVYIEGGDVSPDDTFLSDCENVGLFYKTLFYSFDNLERDKICDKIELATSSRSVAKWISSATGIDHSYIDFVVYDLDDFVDVVQNILAEYDLQTVGLADFNNPAQVTYFRL